MDGARMLRLGGVYPFSSRAERKEEASSNYYSTSTRGYDGRRDSYKILLDGKIADANEVALLFPAMGETAFLVDVDFDGIPDLVDKETSSFLHNPNSLRQDFRDCAFWLPDLQTNAQGQASFRIKMPDDITAWRSHVFAMNKQLQFGRSDGEIKAVKQLSARLSLPRFLVEGDSTPVDGQGDQLWRLDGHTNSICRGRKRIHSQRYNDWKLA